ncbi:MAG: chloride channel protein [Syntrophobacterales bacterium]
MRSPARPQLSSFLKKWRLEEHLTLYLLAIVVGILGGYGAILFRLLIKGSQFIFYQNSNDFLLFAREVPFYLKLLIPALGGLVVGLIVRWGTEKAKAHGVPELIEAVVLRGGRISWRTAAARVSAAAVTIGSGGSVGREGPIIHIGSFLGSAVAQLTRLTRDRERILMSCGAAAGISATFHAPIAGMLFAVEVLLGDFSLGTFSPIVLASVTAAVISGFHLGDFPAFVIPSFQIGSPWEYGLYPLLGILCGLVAVGFTTTLYFCEDRFNSLKIAAWARPALGGLLLGSMLIVVPQVFGVGYGAINLALANQMSLALMGALILAKILATSISLGSGSTGGILAPSIFIGAMTGGTFGWLSGEMLALSNLSAVSSYTLVGMGALVAGCTHAPVTAILLIFELSAEYHIILPLLMACILSTITASIFKRGSIYSLKLLRRGVEISRGREQTILRNITVRDVMVRDIKSVLESAPMVTVVELFRRFNLSCLTVVNAQGELVGIISFHDIAGAASEEEMSYLLIARDMATTEVDTVVPTDTLDMVLQKMEAEKVGQIAVVAEDGSGKLVGLVLEKDVLSTYERELRLRWF